MSKGLSNSKHKEERLQILIDFAKSKGGQCLSLSYKDNKDLLEFECFKKHKFTHSWQSIFKDNRWCRECNGVRSIYSIEDAHRIAQERGGKCHSTEYNQQYEKLSFECHVGHQWQAIFKIILNGSWCPFCTGSIGEEICRVYFETIFNKKFERCRPNLLKQKTGYNLELDGFCSDLQIAFEHNGTQHYKSTPYFEIKRDVKQTIKIDQDKKQLCEANGIKLIIIPEIFTITKLKDLKQFIKNELAKLNILPENYDLLNFNIGKAYIVSSNKNKDYFEKIKNKAIEVGMKCLSENYLNSHEHLLFECSRCQRLKNMSAHTLFNILAYCDSCDSNYWNIEKIRSYALSKNGICLSNEYKNQYSEIQFQCSNNHKWVSVFDRILNCGIWCPQCPIDIEQLNIEAFARGGRCISKEYINLSLPITWECKNTHIFNKSYSKVRIRKYPWCDECVASGKETTTYIDRLSISEKKEIILLLKEGLLLQKEIANKFNVSPSTIIKISKRNLND